MPATYMLRFDDICPTMDWSRWRYIEDILETHRITPVLAIVPDNHLSNLMIDPPNPIFWDEARRWQSRGWTIGLHGYQHTWSTAESGLLGLNDRSEFAGLPRDKQEAKVSAALEIFDREGLTPRLWIAPANSFDETTLSVLRSHGLDVINDGLHLQPFTDDQGTFWIPQQQWRFRKAPAGFWTIAFHHNYWSAQEAARFERQVVRLRDQIVAFDDVIARYAGRRASRLDLRVGALGVRLLKIKRQLVPR